MNFAADRATPRSSTRHRTRRRCEGGDRGRGHLVAPRRRKATARPSTLLAHGADIKAKDKFGYGPLDSAVLCGVGWRLEEVEALLAKGADVMAVEWQLTGQRAEKDPAARCGAVGLPRSSRRCSRRRCEGADMSVHALHDAAKNGHSATVDTAKPAPTGWRQVADAQANRRPTRRQQAFDDRRDPRVAKAEGEKLRKAAEATTVHVLSTLRQAVGGGGGEVVQARVQSDVVKKTKCTEETGWERKSATRTTRGRYRCTEATIKGGGLADKALPREGKAGHLILCSGSIAPSSPEPGTFVFNPTSTTASLWTATPTTPTPSGCATGGRSASRMRENGRLVHSSAGSRRAE